MTGQGILSNRSTCKPSKNVRTKRIWSSGAWLDRKATGCSDGLQRLQQNGADPVANQQIWEDQWRSLSPLNLQQARKEPFKLFFLTLKKGRICQEQSIKRPDLLKCAGPECTEYLNYIKEGVPLRPILSMVNSPQHQMTKWLAAQLRQVVDLHSGNTVKDTFEFCQELQNINFAGMNQDQLANTFMCLFDITVCSQTFCCMRPLICLEELHWN